jgi:hypothetical protein
MLFRRTRERWALGRAAFAAAVEVRDDVERIAEETEVEMLALRKQISDLPGASPLCPRCNGRLVMRSVKEGLNWWKLWICDECGFRATLSDIPRKSLEDALD